MTNNQESNLGAKAGLDSQTTNKSKSHSTSPTANKRVLVVDDNADTADSMMLILRAFGHDVRTAYTGPEAIEVAEEFQPDSVLLDLGLPELDGYEVAKRLRARPQMDGLQLIAVTGYGQQKDIDMSREAGFDAHFVKPVDPTKIQDVLTKIAPSTR